MNDLPTVLFIREETVYGPVYHPANQLASDLAAIAGTRVIPEDRMVTIRKLYHVAAPNGQPIAFPKAAYAKQSVEPRYIKDSA